MVRFSHHAYCRKVQDLKQFAKQMEAFYENATIREVTEEVKEDFEEDSEEMTESTTFKNVKIPSLATSVYDRFIKNPCRVKVDLGQRWIGMAHHGVFPNIILRETGLQLAFAKRMEDVKFATDLNFLCSQFEHIENTYLSGHEVWITSNPVSFAETDRALFVFGIVKNCNIRKAFQYENTTHFLSKSNRVISLMQNCISMSEDIDFDFDDGFCSIEYDLDYFYWCQRHFETWKAKDPFNTESPLPALCL
jgi:hypothetical protein